MISNAFPVNVSNSLNIPILENEFNKNKRLIKLFEAHVSPSILDEVQLMLINHISTEEISESQIEDLFKSHSSPTPINTIDEFEQLIKDFLDNKKIDEFQALFKTPSRREDITKLYTLVSTQNIHINVVKELSSVATVNECNHLLETVKNEKQGWQWTAGTCSSGVSSFKIPKVFYSTFRSLEFKADGSVYILFNQKKQDRVLGRGTFKTVAIAMNLENGEKYARLAAQSTTADAYLEFKKVQEFNGREGFPETLPNPIYFPGSKNGLEKISYMQKIYNGDLDSIFDNQQTQNLTREEKLLIARRLLTAVVYLHDSKKIHRDIKPANVLFERDPETNKIVNACLTDFGFLVDESNSYDRSKSSGSPLYAPPEAIIAARNYSKAQTLAANNYSYDSWCVGIILYQLFQSTISEWNMLKPDPFWFRAIDLDGLYIYLSNLQNNWLPKINDPDSIGHIIKALLDKDPANRMSSKVALEKLNQIQ